MLYLGPPPFLCPLLSLPPDSTNTPVRGFRKKSSVPRDKSRGRFKEILFFDTRADTLQRRRTHLVSPLPSPSSPILPSFSPLLSPPSPITSYRTGPGLDPSLPSSQGVKRICDRNRDLTTTGSGSVGGRVVG